MTRATIKRATIGNIEPVLTNSNKPPNELGSPATIPANIIKDITNSKSNIVFIKALKIL